MPLQESNPLLDIQFRIPFDRIRAEHVEPAIEELLRDARAKLEALAADTGPPTFENTMQRRATLGKRVSIQHLVA